ncbi:MAG: adenylate kinase [Candidatus Parcubacteria bacterium]|jgi:adenylate kinase
MKIILLGLPCAGKDTHGKRLALTFGIAHLAVGNIARHEVQARTALGHRIMAEREARGYLSDELAQLLTEIAMKDHDSWILNGFPRTVAQARDMQGIDLVIYLDIPDEISIRRMLARKRHDDLSETPQVRVAKVKERLPSLIEYCEQTWPFVTINAVPPEDVVWQEILAKTGHLFQR